MLTWYVHCPQGTNFTSSCVAFLLYLVMITKPKQAKQKSSVCHCLKGCGFSLQDKDQHKTFHMYLQIVHASRALAKPEDCAFCHLVRDSTLERQGLWRKCCPVTWHDPSLSESRVPVICVSVHLIGKSQI